MELRNKRLFDLNFVERRVKRKSGLKSVERRNKRQSDLKFKKSGTRTWKIKLPYFIFH